MPTADTEQFTISTVVGPDSPDTPRMNDRTSTATSAMGPPEAAERSKQRPRVWRTGARARLLSKMEERAVASSAAARPRYSATDAHDRWDPAKKDHELWIRQGTCFVHLHAQDEPRRGPSFRLPLSALLNAHCHPILDRFVANGAKNPVDWDAWLAANPDFRVQLYMPAPATASDAEAYCHHLATRNFFAWVLRGRLIYDTLGGALVDLLGCMVNHRGCGLDNVADLIEFLKDQGHWEFRNQPANALAALYLAETYRLRDVYVDAFAHCVGMAGQLTKSPEYRNIPSAIRRLIRQAKFEADTVLGRVSVQMGSFLAADLSEAHLGLPAGARSHLERFQEFLVAFYSGRLGSFPPEHIQDASAAAWAPGVYRMLRDDFEALYNLLVDESFTSAENTPFLAQGGICAVQSVHSFDVRHQFQSLRHPLPLLPEIAPGMLPSSSLWPLMSPNSSTAGTASSASPPTPGSPTSPRRRFSRSLSMSLSSFGLSVGAGTGANGGRPDKLRPDERLVTHAALIKATNLHHAQLLDNPLVQAYRRFEEEGTCGPIPSSRFASRAAERERERVSLVDARKVRWILVYAMYQMVRSVTEAAPEVHDADDAPYLLFSSMTNGLPLWHADEEFLEDDMAQVATEPSIEAQEHEDSPTIELKPDIDYMEMYQQQEQQRSSPNRAKGLHIDTQLAGAVAAPPNKPLSPKSPGLAMSLSRRGILHRSLSMFGSSQGTPGRTRKIKPMASTEELPLVPSLSVVKRRTSRHNEIVVQGYGNGLTSAIVNAEAADDPYRPTSSLAPAAPVTSMVATTTSGSATASASTQRSMSTSSHGSNGSKNSSVASYNTAPTTAPVTPTNETGHHHHYHHLLLDKARMKHHSAPCSQPVQSEDLPSSSSGVQPGPGLGLGNMPWALPTRSMPRRASSLVTPQSTPQSSLQPRGRSSRSATNGMPSRSTPSSRAPSADTRLSRCSSAIALRPMSVHESLLRSSDSTGSRRRHYSGENGDKGLPPIPMRTRTKSWRGSVADPELVAWTIVSPSLGQGNTCPLELDTRASMGFSARVGLA